MWFSKYHTFVPYRLLHRNGFLSIIRIWCRFKHFSGGRGVDGALYYVLTRSLRITRCESVEFISYSYFRSIFLISYWKRRRTMLPLQVTFFETPVLHSLVSWMAGRSGRNVTVIPSIVLVMHPLVLDAQYGTINPIINHHYCTRSVAFTIRQYFFILNDIFSKIAN